MVSALLVAQMRKVLQTCAPNLDLQVEWQTSQALQTYVLILLLGLLQALALTRKDSLHLDPEVLPLTLVKALRTSPPIYQGWVPQALVNALIRFVEEPNLEVESLTVSEQDDQPDCWTQELLMMHHSPEPVRS